MEDAHSLRRGGWAKDDSQSGETAAERRAITCDTMTDAEREQLDDCP
jgi:hypothetical protein